MKQEGELKKQQATDSAAPKLDLSFKEGQTIKISIGVSVKLLWSSKTKGTKLHFPNVILFWQNIKKKDAGGAKTRPAAGGFLPPPPGAKAGGLIPPPAGQHSFPPVQANNGEANSLC